jgi:hypothetical protein
MKFVITKHLQYEMPFNRGTITLTPGQVVEGKQYPTGATEVEVSPDHDLLAKTTIWLLRGSFAVVAPHMDDLHNHKAQPGRYGGKTIIVPAYGEAVEVKWQTHSVHDERVSVAFFTKEGINYRVYFPKDWSVYKMAMWLRWHRRTDCEVSFINCHSINVSAGKNISVQIEA